MLPGQHSDDQRRKQLSRDYSQAHVAPTEFLSASSLYSSKYFQVIRLWYFSWWFQMCVPGCVCVFMCVVMSLLAGLCVHVCMYTQVHTYVHLYVLSYVSVPFGKSDRSIIYFKGKWIHFFPILQGALEFNAVVAQATRILVMQPDLERIAEYLWQMFSPRHDIFQTGIISESPGHEMKARVL